MAARSLDRGTLRAFPYAQAVGTHRRRREAILAGRAGAPITVDAGSRARLRERCPAQERVALPVAERVEAA